MRSFKVIDVRKHGGCKTKFKEGRYMSSTPFGAAKKAFTKLCKVKKTRGKCTLLVTLQETTVGSAKKQFQYKLSRTKLPTPVVRFAGTDKEFTIKYSVDGKAVHNIPACKSQKGQTRGRMKGGGDGIIQIPLLRAMYAQMEETNHNSVPQPPIQPPMRTMKIQNRSVQNGRGKKTIKGQKVITEAESKYRV